MNKPAVGTRKTNRPRLGIVTGSGPEAGLDLWDKILKANRLLLGANFRGDLDAPNVTIYSEPALGHAFNIVEYERPLWQTLRPLVEQIVQRVDYYAIACNSLNYYQSQIDSLNHNAKLISFFDSVVTFLTNEKISRIALLGTPTVMGLSKWSHYHHLNKHVDVETITATQTQQLQTIIQEVKLYGSDSSRTIKTFDALLRSVHCDTVLLACTELPLIPINHTRKKLIDVTQLVATQLAQLSLGVTLG